jgi:hypothetical protein
MASGIKICFEKIQENKHCCHILALQHSSKGIVIVDEGVAINIRMIHKPF